MRFMYILCLLLCFLSLGCAEQVVEIPFQRSEMRNVSKVAILSPNMRPDLFMDVTADDHFLLLLLSGPAIINQLLVTAAMRDARKEDTRMFNELTFDFHVGRILKESFYRKLQRSAPFYIIPLEKIEDNRVVNKLQDKREKTPEDYKKIAMELGADTVIELTVLAGGVKDPGIFSKPSALLIAKAAMFRIPDNRMLWQTRVAQAIPQKKSFRSGYDEYLEEEAKSLRGELDSLAGMLAEQLIESLGFKSHIPTGRLLENINP